MYAPECGEKGESKHENQYQSNYDAGHVYPCGISHVDASGSTYQAASAAVTPLPKTLSAFQKTSNASMQVFRCLATTRFEYNCGQTLRVSSHKERVG